MAEKQENWHLPETEIREILLEQYNIVPVKMKMLNGYYDLNYFIKVDDGREFLFKIYHHEHKTVDELYGENDMLNFLCQRHFPVPSIERTITDGANFYSHVNRNRTETRLMRLQNFFRGQIMGNVPITPAICAKLGDIIGRMDYSLVEISDNPLIPRANEKAGTEWNLEFLSVLKQWLWCLDKQPQNQELIKRAIDYAEEKINPVLKDLPEQAIHGDINEQNVIVNDEGTEIVGVIDFGDAVISKRVFEPAVAMVYWLLFGAEPVQCVKAFYEAYSKAIALTPVEKSVVLPCMIGRFCQSLINGNHAAHYLIEQCKPTDYVLMTSKHGFELLRQLMDSPLSAELASFFENN